jgi:hypothetical protein
MVRRLLAAAAVLVVMPLAAMLAPSAASAATTATCTGGVAVTEFAFNPSSVQFPGGAAPLTLVLQNCTSQPLQGSSAWSGAYNGQGCPVSDPITFPYTIAAGGTYSLTNTFGDPGFQNCHPTSLLMRANINVTGVGTVTTVSAGLQFTTGCPNGIAISQFSFSPPSVPVGQNSTLTLVLRNCSSQARQGSSIWMPKFTGASTGLPPGCPVLDPVAFSYMMPAGGTSTATLQLGDPIATCPATGIQATVNVDVDGVTGTAATATANLVITQPVTGGCHVTYAASTWTGGFTATVTIANNGASAINGWTLAFTFPGDEKITNFWNANVTQTGSSVTATNMSYNATIAPGASVTFGFYGTWATSAAPPATFTVNGMTCM